MEEKGGVSNGKVGQEHIQDLLFSNRLSWQAIIYDLINTEQLDPWDIDLSMLADKFLEKLKLLDEANFFISSKVLLAASFLLRLKSEVILHKYLPALDAILSGEKEEKKYEQERIELDENIPMLIPRTPLPRMRKVTLEEIMEALGNAITTETRRIKRIAIDKQRLMEAQIVMPKTTINIQDQIKSVYSKLRNVFEQRSEKMPFSAIAGNNVEDNIANFVSLLHLDSQHKVVLEQNNHFDEIWVWMKEHYDKEHAELLAQLSREVEEAMIEFEKTEKEKGESSKEETAEEEDEEDFGNGKGLKNLEENRKEEGFEREEEE